MPELGKRERGKSNTASQLSGGTPGDAVDGKSVELNFWYSFSGSVNETIEALVKRFNESYPAIKVNAQSAPGRATYVELCWADTYRNYRGQPMPVQVGGLMYEDVGAAIMHYPDKLVTLDLTGWEKGWSMEYYGTNASLIVHPYSSRFELYYPHYGRSLPFLDKRHQHLNIVKSGNQR